MSKIDIKEISKLLNTENVLRIGKSKDYVYITDNHIMIRVNGDLTHTEELTYELLSVERIKYAVDNIYSCINKEKHITISINDIQLLISDNTTIIEYETVEGECNECDGFGEVKWMYYSTVEDCEHYLDEHCPICEGSGVITKEVRVEEGSMRKEVKEDVYVFILEYTISLLRFEVIRRLLEMTGTEYVDVNIVNEVGIYFRINDNIDVVIARQYVNDNDKIVKRYE